MLGRQAERAWAGELPELHRRRHNESIHASKKVSLLACHIMQCFFVLVDNLLILLRFAYIASRGRMARLLLPWSQPLREIGLGFRHLALTAPPQTSVLRLLILLRVTSIALRSKGVCLLLPRC